MGETIYETVMKFSDDLEKSLSNHVEEFLQKINESKLLSESQLRSIKIRSSKSKIPYLLKNCILPRLQAGHSHIFDFLIEYMKNSDDKDLRILAEKLLEGTVPTIYSEQVTDSTSNGMYMHMYN